MKDETIKINGYSEGDSSVGIGQGEFSIDTGLTEIDEDLRNWIIRNLIRDMYEIQDNGNLHFNFSDEETDNDFGYTRRFTYEMAIKVDEEERLAFIQQKGKRCNHKQFRLSPILEKKFNIFLCDKCYRGLK
jgi:hypothetical protein